MWIERTAFSNRKVCPNSTDLWTGRIGECWLNFSSLFLFSAWIAAWAANHLVKLNAGRKDPVWLVRAYHAWIHTLHTCMQRSSLEMKKYEHREREKRKDVNINWLGDVCGIKLVIIEVCHYEEECNFKLQNFLLVFQLESLFSIFQQ